MKRSTYQQITDQLIALLETNTVPWRQSWKGYAWAPRNLASGKAYRGINTFLLSCAPYSSPYWVSYKQAQQFGGNVRSGEKGWMIVFFRMLEKKDAKGDTKEIPLMRSFKVFNVEQCDGIDHKRLNEITESHSQFEPLERCDEVVQGYQDGPNISHGEPRAYYRPSDDSVNMPQPDSFDTSENYYSVLFHELGHSTGHKSRLAREGVTNPVNFASHTYSKEELIAEFTAAYLCGHCGIETTLENSAAYLQGWIKVLKGDSKLAYQAAAAAQKASDRILGA